MAFASIPYVKGVSERIRRILGKENVKTTYRQVKTLGTRGNNDLANKQHRGEDWT